MARDAANKLPSPPRVMNEEVRSWYPDLSDPSVIKKSMMGSDYNIMYHGLELEPSQKAVVAEFRSWMTSQGLEPSTTLQLEDTNNDYRFLTNHNENFEETYDAMVVYEEWLQTSAITILESYERIKPALEAGVLYGAGRDKQMRPVLIYNLKRGHAAGLDFDDFLDACDFLFLYTIFNANVDGQFESINLLLDMKGIAVY